MNDFIINAVNHRLQNTPMGKAIQFYNMGRNPQVMFNQLMQNPQVVSYMNDLRHQCEQSGLSEKDFTIQTLKNVGMSEEEVVQFVKMNGFQL